jgi:pyridoxal phosphate enzyme (YggS family)
MNPTIKNYHATLSRIREAEIQHHCQPNSVLCLAVSKTFAAEALLPIIALGQQHFAENYLQEAINKISALSEKNLIWHYIGRIQTNKCKEIAQNFSWVHTLYRIKEAKALAKYRPPGLPPLQVCLQIKLDDLQDRGGVEPNEVLTIAQEVSLHNNLKLRGIMLLPPPNLSTNEQREIFKTAHQLGKVLTQQGYAIDTYSMGMTQDLESAIAEGATIVRVGSGIFGQRDKKT